MLLGTGARAEECGRLSVADVPLTARTGQVRLLGIGDQPRRVPLPARARERVAVLVTTLDPPEGALWRGQRGPLTVAGVTQLVLAVGAHAAIPGLRHTGYATPTPPGSARTAPTSSRSKPTRTLLRGHLRPVLPRRPRRADRPRRPCLPDLSQPPDRRALHDLDQPKRWFLAAYYGATDHPERRRRGHPPGTFAVQWKDLHHRSAEYNNAPMEYSVSFAPGGIAFHQGSLQKQSAGCVHLSAADAAAWYDYLQVGDQVQVH